MRKVIILGSFVMMLTGCGGDDSKGACDCTDTTTSSKELCRCPPQSLDASTDAATKLDAQTLLDANRGADACVALPCPSGAPWNAASCSCQMESNGSTCSGVGNYERGKGDSVPNCCPSLTMVDQLSPAEVGDNHALACVFEPLFIFACIEGTCGDGRCEAPEAVHCGCLSDCPSAAFGSWDGGAAH